LGENKPQALLNQRSQRFVAIRSLALGLIQ
jgi:hypothetical protein